MTGTPGHDRIAWSSAPRREALTEALADDNVAVLLQAGGAAFAAAGSPMRIVWATRSALDLFGVPDLAHLTALVLDATSSGARRLAELAADQPPDGKGRLHRLRFLLTPGDRPLTLLTLRHVAATGGGALLLAAVVGVQAESGDTVALPPLHDVTAFADDGASATPSPAAEPTVEHAIDALRAKIAAAAKRFVWQTNAAGLLCQLDARVADVFGGETLAVGDHFANRLRDIGADRDGRLAAALAARQTCAGIESSWPALDGRARVGVRLAATPQFSAEQEFAGFRGFGIVLAESIVGAPGEEAAQTPAGLSMFPTPAEMASPLNPPERASIPQGREPPPTRSADSVPPGERLRSMEEDYFDIPAVSIPSIEAGADGPGDTPAPPEPLEPRTRMQSIEVAITPVDPPEREARQSVATAPETYQNVVSLRPDGVAADARAASRPTGLTAAERPSPDDPIQLSSGERHAFREIARALGARIEADEPMPDFPKSAQVAPPSRNTAWIFAKRPAPTQPDPPSAGETAEDTGLARNAAVVLDRLPVGVVICRGDVPLYINRTLLDLLGFDNADAFYASGGIDQMFRGRAPELFDAGPQGGSVPIVAVNGELLTVDARLHTIAWDGLPATLISFRRSQEADAALRPRAVELDMRARESELRELHAILDTATDGVVVIDDAGHILSINRSAQAVFGYDQAEVKNKPFSVLFVPTSHATVQDYLLGLKGNGPQSVRNDGREVVGRERQGGHIPLYLTLGRIANDGAGKLCAVLRDLTQFRRAEHELQLARKQAEKASALKSDFLAKVSHEIRTPLNSILGFTEVIMDERLGPVGNERYKDYLKDIHASGAHVLSLVNDLLDLSKIEAGKAEMNFVAVDANRVISECVSLMQPQAGKVRVIVRLSLAATLPPVVADERALRQIILNLLSNAIKFTEAGGQIIVSTAMTESGNAVIRVKDTGIGMNEEEIGQALEPFRQLSTARQTTGTGLGLPLTKALIEANRASLAIRSRRNEGTLVEVIFPATRVLSE